MTPHPARPVPQGADPQLAGMLGPLVDHLADSDAEPDWRLDTLPNAQQHQDELSDICGIMFAAGHNGPLRDTIPALITAADDADLLRERLADAKQFGSYMKNLRSKDLKDLDVAAETLARRQDRVDELERRCVWVLREALFYCAAEGTVDDD